MSIKYSDGDTIEVGDLVFVETEERIYLVNSLIVSEEEMLEWGLSEKGVFLTQHSEVSSKNNDFFFGEKILAKEPLQKK